MKNLYAVIVVLLLFMYVYGVVGVFLFKGAYSGLLPSDTPPGADFENFLDSQITLFQMVTGQNWDQIMFAVMASDGLGAAWYFMSFVLFVTLLYTQLIVAMVVEAWMSSEEQMRHNVRQVDEGDDEKEEDDEELERRAEEEALRKEELQEQEEKDRIEKERLEKEEKEKERKEKEKEIRVKMERQKSQGEAEMVEPKVIRKESKTELNQQPLELSDPEMGYGTPIIKLTSPKGSLSIVPPLKNVQTQEITENTPDASSSSDSRPLLPFAEQPTRTSEQSIDEGSVENV